MPHPVETEAQLCPSWAIVCSISMGNASILAYRHEGRNEAKFFQLILVHFLGFL